MSESIPQIPLLNEWERKVAASKQAGYVESEVKRLAKSGERLLLAILSLPDSTQLDMCRIAARRASPTVYLRLRPGAKPPLTDPQGRALPSELRGKVLVAKLATRGADPGADEDGLRPWQGPGRQFKSARGQDLYETVTIGSEPVSLPFDEALTVFRQWGVFVHASGLRKTAVIAGAASSAEYAARKQELEAQGLIVQGAHAFRDVWLVEQCDAQGRPLPVSTENTTDNSNRKQSNNERRA